MAAVTTVSATSASRKAYQILHFAFTIAPVIAGIDKFFNKLVDWEKYLAPAVNNMIAAHTFMMIVGVIEIIAGLIVLWKPRVGAFIVAIWLLGIIVNLLIIPGFFDVALRDFGLLLGALALGFLSFDFDHPAVPVETARPMSAQPS